MDTVKHLRIYADADGETHWGEIEAELNAYDLAPYGPPMGVSAAFPAAEYILDTAPPGWYCSWHPAPRRQLVVLLRGELEVQTSDGSIKLLRPGDMVLAEDTAGKGHYGRAVGMDGLLMLTVQLPR